MKRTIVALFVALLVLSGCGSDDGDTEASNGTPDTEVSTATVEVEVWFVDQDAFNEGRAPYVVAVTREVAEDQPHQGAVDALFDGPTGTEGDEALTFVPSGATGASVESVKGGIAVVQLQGGCASGGSTLTVADQLFPTLQQFDDVDIVKILDPDGTTAAPDNDLDSIPECLEP